MIRDRTDGAMSEELAQQRGVQRAKAELARCEYPARAEPNDRRRRAQRLDASAQC